MPRGVYILSTCRPSADSHSGQPSLERAGSAARSGRTPSKRLFSAPLNGAFTARARTAPPNTRAAIPPAPPHTLAPPSMPPAPAPRTPLRPNQFAPCTADGKPPPPAAPRTPLTRAALETRFRALERMLRALRRETDAVAEDLEMRERVFPRMNGDTRTRAPPPRAATERG